MIIPLFFFLGLFFWVFLASAFGVFFSEHRNPLDLVASCACLLAAMAPARELKFLPNLIATPVYFVSAFVALGGVCAVVVFEAQRRRK